MDGDDAVIRSKSFSFFDCVPSSTPTYSVAISAVPEHHRGIKPTFLTVQYWDGSDIKFTLLLLTVSVKEGSKIDNVTLAWFFYEHKQLKSNNWRTNLQRHKSIICFKIAVSEEVVLTLLILAMDFHMFRLNTSHETINSKTWERIISPPACCRREVSDKRSCMLCSSLTGGFGFCLTDLACSNCTPRSSASHWSRNLQWAHGKGDGILIFMYKWVGLGPWDQSHIAFCHLVMRGSK